MLLVSEIRKRPDGIHFDQKCEIKEKLLERDPNILDIDKVMVTGKVQYDNGLILLDYQLSYELTLPSSRSMIPVTLSENQMDQELFIQEEDIRGREDLIEDQLVLVLEDNQIDLEESIVDNILLAIPLQVLTDEEKVSQDLPTGQNWTVLTEEQYQALQAEKEKENNPFSSLQGLFDE
ncbi:YceD family protein [Streptococcus ictaluri]|uniref:ACR, COG1399 n=1 Tax=Streptococcus ictaluri 707-05 TaxID=764299 RepID=G5K1C1_9STRE|nr:YceD family protein [Streptococcus ictaluri]EHI70321.1 hypothetical protein STRIC_2178 [Streptococcus ictaluri 707-05]